MLCDCVVKQVRDFKFMCPNDTVFDQENFICANWFEIDCRSSTLFYDKNLQLFQPEDRNKTGGGGGSSSVASTTDRPSEQQKRQQEQQLKQLMVLEEQQAAQVLRQQQVLEQHERRQQEHQVNWKKKKKKDISYFLHFLKLRTKNKNKKESFF